MPREGVWALFSESWGVVEGFWANRYQSSCLGKLLWWQYWAGLRRQGMPLGRVATWAGGDEEGTRMAEVKMGWRKETDVRDNAEAHGTWAGCCLDTGWESWRSNGENVLAQKRNKNLLWYLWSWRQEWFYVDVGVMHLQVMVPESPGHSNSCHYTGLGV